MTVPSLKTKNHSIVEMSHTHTHKKKMPIFSLLKRCCCFFLSSDFFENEDTFSGMLADKRATFQSRINHDKFTQVSRCLKHDFSTIRHSSSRFSDKNTVFTLTKEKLALQPYSPILLVNSTIITIHFLEISLAKVHLGSQTARYHLNSTSVYPLNQHHFWDL